MAMSDDSPLLPGADRIGRSINVIEGAYSNFLDIVDRGPLVDVTLPGSDGKDVTYQLPKNVDPPALLSGGHVEYNVASSRHELQKSFAANASLDGTYGIFSGDVKGYFEDNKFLSQETSFSVTRVQTCEWGLQWSKPLRFQDLLPEVAQKWQEYADKKDYLSIFTEFGTHVVRYVQLGSSLDHAVSWSRTETSDESKFGAQVDLAFAALQKALSTGAKVDYSSMDKEMYSQLRISTSVVGGDSSLGTDLSQDGANYQAWRDSCKGNPAPIALHRVPIGFEATADSSTSSLLEITALAPDSYRADMQAALDRYLYDVDLLVSGGGGHTPPAAHGNLILGDVSLPWDSKLSDEGMQIMVLNLNDLDNHTSDIYATTGSPDGQDSLADLIRKQTSDNLVVVVSGGTGWGTEDGKPPFGITDPLKNALENLADEQFPADWQFGWNQPFVCMGIPRRGGFFMVRTDDVHELVLSGALTADPSGRGFVVDVTRVTER